MRRVLWFAVLLLCSSIMASGIPLNVDVSIGYVGLGHVNGLINDFADEYGADLSEMHVGVGGGLEIGAMRVLGAGEVTFGGRGLVSQQTGRDASVSASLLGLCLGLGYDTGRLRASVDVGAYRGALTFSEARYVDLVGWGPGVAAQGEVRILSRERLSATAGLSVRWLPIYEMEDSSGQTFRGRGTPFLDFSGISVSIGLQWRF